MMDFKELLIRAQRGEKNAQEELLKMYLCIKLVGKRRGAA